MWLPDPRLEYPSLYHPGRKPAGFPVAVDWSHPLARGLVDIVLARGDQHVSIAHGEAFTANGSDMSGVIGPGGEATAPTVQTTDAYQLGPADTEDRWRRPASAVTCLVVLRRTGAAVGNAPIFSNASPNVAPYTAWGFDDSGGAGTLRFSASPGGAFKAVSSSSGLTGNLEVVIGTYDGANIRLYSDGVELASTAATGDLGYPNTGAPAIGNSFSYLGSNRSFNGEIYACALWDIGLNAAEVSAITSDPYQMLIPA